MNNTFSKITRFIRHNKEIVIIVILFVVFITISLAAFWDLYGEGMFSKNEVSAPTPSITTLSPHPIIPSINQSQNSADTKENKPLRNQQIDTTMFSSCMTDLTTKKECKDCCEGLNLDTATNDTCRKTCNRAIMQ